MTEFYACFVSTLESEPQFTGPWLDEGEAQDYVNERNSALAAAGIPSSVASWDVVL